jgi:hypothetical protein
MLPKEILDALERGGRFVGDLLDSERSMPDRHPFSRTLVKIVPIQKPVPETFDEAQRNVVPMSG